MVGAYLSFYTLYLNSVNFNEQLRIFCVAERFNHSRTTTLELNRDLNDLQLL